jgi:hypothetical protein
MAVIAGVEQASCRLKDFGGIIVCQRVGNDLVNREVRTVLIGRPSSDDLVAALTKRLNALGVVAADHGCAKVGVCEVVHATSSVTPALGF